MKRGKTLENELMLPALYAQSLLFYLLQLVTPGHGRLGGLFEYLTKMKKKQLPLLVEDFSVPIVEFSIQLFNFSNCTRMFWKLTSRLKFILVTVKTCLSSLERE